MYIYIYIYMHTYTYVINDIKGEATLLTHPESAAQHEEQVRWPRTG